MRLFLLGATGRTGTELVDLALRRGHEVTAFVRSPEKITRREPALHVVKGNPRHAEEIAAVLPSHDAVLSSLGPTPREAMRFTSVLEDCASSTVEAMTQTKVNRFLVVSSALLFDIRGPLPAFVRVLMRHHLRDLRAMEAEVQASSLDWTIARPPRLVRDPDERYRVAEGAVPPGVPFLSARLSWRAVATFLVDALDDERLVRKTVGISR